MVLLLLIERILFMIIYIFNKLTVYNELTEEIKSAS